MRRDSKRLAAALLAAGLLFASRLPAQDARGRILGRVTDSSTAVIAGAEVIATQVDMNTRVTARTNEAGNYDLEYLLPGTYRVEVQAPGFKRYSRHPIELRVGDAVTLNISLEVGNLTDCIEVVAEASLLEASTASMAKVVEHKQLSDLPLGGGAAFFLTSLTAGVTSTLSPASNWLPSAVDTMSNVNIAGTSNTANEYTLDGISNMTRGGWMGIAPPPDMVQEFRVQTATYDASLGHASGGTVSLSLKAGTNAPHGTVQWDVAPNPWQATDFFANKQIYDLSTGPVTGEKIKRLSPPRKVNRYGATVNGPVYFPKLYNGRNKTFWTYGFSGFDRRNPATGSTYYTVPSAAERAGDFSALLKLGTIYQIYDPGTIASAGSGRFSRQPFAGNIVPANRISPLAQNYLKFFPAPNLAGTSNGLQNYQIWAPDNNDFRENLARVDHNFTERNRLFGRFSQSWLHYYHGNIFGNASRGLDRYRKNWGGALDDVYTFSPSLILNVKYGFTRYLQSDYPFSAGYDLTQVGVPAGLAQQIDPQARMFPQVTFDAFTQLGESGGNRFITNYHNFSGGFTKITGNHSLRWGGEFRVLRENTLNYGNETPTFAFSSTWTRGPLDNSAAAPIGQDLASFLLGLPTGGSIDVNSSYSEQSTFAGLYLQDDWKITRKLTLNAGLRWEMEGSPTEPFDRTASGFDFSAASPVSQAASANYAAHPDAIPVSQFKTMGVLTFGGVNGQPRGYFATSRRNFAPRLGLAYQFTPKTVLRGGYGIFFDSVGINNNHANQEGFSQTTNLTPSTDNGLTFTGTLANPFPNGVVQPSPVGPNTYIGRAISFYPGKLLTPYSQRWSFSIQQELPGRAVVEVSYLGNKSVHLSTSQQIDATPAQYLSTSPFRDAAAINYLTAAVTSPFSGIPQFAGSAITGTTISRANLLRPYPQYNGITVQTANGSSWYHALLMRAEKRYSHGVTVNLDYTWSKWMEATGYLNPTDPSPTHVISASDRPHRVAVSGV